MKPQGWRNNSYGHKMASYGIKIKMYHSHYMRDEPDRKLLSISAAMMVEKDYEKVIENIDDLYYAMGKGDEKEIEWQTYHLKEQIKNMNTDPETIKDYLSFLNDWNVKEIANSEGVILSVQREKLMKLRGIINYDKIKLMREIK